MAYYSLHAYDADVWISEFRGLNQVDESLSADPRYATEAVNVETPRGVLQPHAGSVALSGEFPGRVETIMRFYRRWFNGGGGNGKSTLVCAAAGRLYARDEEDETGEWETLPMPDDMTAFESNVWSWVTYEVNNPNEENPTDVLLISNPKDGMFMITPPDRPGIWADVMHNVWNNPDDETWQDDYDPRWAVTVVDTRANPEDDDEPQKKFAVIERYAERVWGCGVESEPDTLYYSRPYDPTDWTPAGENEQDEDCAGEIRQPSWDGDSFTALKSFGSQLLAFKGHRVWRVLGTNPGEYSFKEQFGGGAPYPATIAVDVEKVLLTDLDGLSVYDGASVRPVAREAIRRLWATVNRDALDQMCAVLYQNRYYLAFPTGTSAVNNALLILNQDDGDYLYYDDIRIENLLATYDTLYATSSDLPGRVMKLLYDSWETGKTTGSGIKWVSPWIDFGRKTYNKGGFEIYFSPEVRNYPVTFRFSIQTEKKTKAKYVTVQPTLAKAKQKRVRFGGTGRRFRLIIETTALPENATWRLLGGIQMVVETDPD